MKKKEKVNLNLIKWLYRWLVKYAVKKDWKMWDALFWIKVNEDDIYDILYFYSDWKLDRYSLKDLRRWLKYFVDLWIINYNKENKTYRYHLLEFWEYVEKNFLQNKK